MTMLNDLNQLSGEKLPTFKHLRINDAVKGRVLRSNIVELTDRQTGKQKKSLVIDLEVLACRGGNVEKKRDADGLDQISVTDHVTGEKVTVWLNPGFGIGAIRDALNTAGAAALEDGATLTIKLVEKRDVGKESPANVFEAVYQPPAGGVNVEDI